MKWLLPDGVARLLAARRDIARLLPRAGAALVAASAVVNVLLGLLPVLFVVAGALVLGRVPAAVEGGTGSPAFDALIRAFVLAAASFVGQQILAPAQQALGESVARRIDGRVLDELMDAAMSQPGIAALEDARVVEDLRAAARELESGVQSPGQAGAGLLALGARQIQLLGYVAVVGFAFSWLAAAGLLTAVLLFRHGHVGGLRKYAGARFDLGSQEMGNDYLRNLATSAEAAKEIRVFGLMRWLQDRLHSSYTAWLEPLWKIRRAIYLGPFLWYTLWMVLVSGAALAAIGTGAADGNAGQTLTVFAMVLQAALGALRLAEFYPESDLQTAIGMHAYEAVRRFTDHLDATPADAAGEMRGDEVPEPAGVIHFDHVTFRYPGEDRAVFEDLDLEIPVGSCTALVGLNGAGKTTLVKLLTRLYEPSAGVIRLDGVDIASYPLEAWRAKTAVIFQDFARYEVSAADNVAFGAVHRADDTEGVRRAIEAVGLTGALDALPRGTATPLARHLEGGAELSGGQWQRLALARALFALEHGSSVLVMDEPTASLDVRAEAGFFEEFTSLTRGATTMLISHRFSTVRRADVIVVLDGGRVIERGSHEQLLERDGRYAELFRLQADRFTDDDDGAGHGVPAEVLS
ncbi:ABC transporter ATP-binding protein [Streptomyces drozdowiczii]|uniref:ABC transporter ATP-binding protein/permease n=1 Tax=Streptomyces drozdowiczii TaxID=202862 RepID=A0ABY6Q0T2_9ACTN|nr:ABC transporter ATP-binding protein [Streptomyces drozdowiczii]MCX0241731.1 ABC transporter ATP-binding protein/permease [Streptomyces drozdowiczii]UZK58047.1 ABC transporter ATP-binding protein/permease [Streptomyces drozdowiczii]